MKERGNRGCKQLAEQGEHDARPGPGDHRASAVENKQRQRRGGQGRSPVLHSGGRSRAAAVRSRSHRFRRPGGCRLAALAS
jgi:hypothetical protein